MTQKEKDDLCDGRNFQNTLEQIQFIDKRNQSPSLKPGQQQHHTASNINASKENCYEYDQNIFPISNQALSYAATTHLQPIKLECEPKLKEQKLVVKFIQQFFKFIEKAFRQQNITYQKAIGFEQWWIDKNGDIQGVTNEID
ncbi:unnamed protein product [Rotaria sp. Silwood2]|nr:unnamed protein product [Rotaria sp. Silwood2]CAF4486511.1 unnamed protein product [Rotaria sp. Silwood2]